MSDLKPLGSEKLSGQEQINRILEIRQILIAKFRSFEFVTKNQKRMKIIYAQLLIFKNSKPIFQFD